MGGGGSRSRPQASPGRIPHRTIDFLMPEKTHGRSLLWCRGVGGLLKLLRWLVAQGRMQPEAIVVLLDECLDVRAQIIEIAILVGMDFLSLQRFHKALAAGIVVRVRWSAHARNHVVPPQDGHVISRRILHPAVRVVHQTGWWLPPRNRALQRGQR